jgi:hypothetical protein
LLDQPSWVVGSPSVAAADSAGHFAAVVDSPRRCHRSVGMPRRSSAFSRKAARCSWVLVIHSAISVRPAAIGGSLSRRGSASAEHSGAMTWPGCRRRSSLSAAMARWRGPAVIRAHSSVFHQHGVDLFALPVELLCRAGRCPVSPHAGHGWSMIARSPAGQRAGDIADQDRVIPDLVHHPVPPDPQPPQVR